MIKEIKIRKAALKDIDCISELLIQVNNVHHEGRPDLFLADKTKYSKEELKGILEDSDRPVFSAVNEDDTVLGYAVCEFQVHGGNNQPDFKTLYIDDICVDRLYRKNHIGLALYQHVLHFARESGCYNVVLNVWEKNPSARHFYEACGMQVQKTTMEKIL